MMPFQAEPSMDTILNLDLMHPILNTNQRCYNCQISNIIVACVERVQRYLLTFVLVVDWQHDDESLCL